MSSSFDVWLDYFYVTMLLLFIIYFEKAMMAFMDDIVMRNQLPLIIWFEVKVLTMGEENFKILSKRMSER